MPGATITRDLALKRDCPDCAELLPQIFTGTGGRISGGFFEVIFENV